MVVVGSKKAGNIGAIARAAASFECEDLRLVRLPRADIDTSPANRRLPFASTPHHRATHHRLTNLPTYPSPTQHAQVAPRVDPTSRASLSSAKGAQHVVHGAGESEKHLWIVVLTRRLMRSSQSFTAGSISPSSCSTRCK